jgi:hypothetical protein
VAPPPGVEPGHRASEARAWNPPGRRHQSPRQESNLDEWLRRPLPGIHQDEESNRPRDVDRQQRKREVPTPTRSRVRTVFETVLAPSQFLSHGVRAAGIEPAIYSPPDCRFCQAKLRPENKWPSLGTSWARTRERTSCLDVRAGTHAERDINRARSPQYGCQSSGTSPSSRRIGGTTGSVSGLSGLLSSFIPASSGVRLPLRSLQA